MRIFRTCLLMLLLSSSFVSMAQSQSVNGIVMNEAGDALAGITITVKETGYIIKTDSVGGFSLAVSKLPITLIFTGAGYKSLEFGINDKNIKAPVKIILPGNSSELAEVVVIGYGLQKKASITGSVTRMEHRSITPGIKIKKSGIGQEDKIVIGKTPVDIKPGSKVLTAGELSDFKKWKLWSDYTESEFRSWSEHWNMAPRVRYCVQVQNEDHRALAGEKVYLINKNTKDTVWNALTDNTGKAELWANLQKEEDDQATYTITCGKEIIRFPAEFENDINRITIKKACESSSIVDIAFVVDATGSMGDEIRYLQEELQDVIGRTTEKYKDVLLHIGSVFYRDHGDEYLTRHIDFQTDPLRLINFVKEQSANGGGDGPEAVEDALTTSLDSLHWHGEARAKIMFLVLDAPPHDAAKMKMAALVKKAAAKGIRIIPVVCSGIDKSAEYLMRCIALETNGSYVFLTDDSGIGNPHIKPTTDEFKVELLNDLLQRLISEMIYMAPCAKKELADQVMPGPDTKNSELTIYPNPSKGNVHIQSSGAIKELFITDFAGKLLMRKLASGNKAKWDMDLTAYPSGVYLVKYVRDDKSWGSEKILLMH